jgi:pyruvate dehydrogenase E1 component beta subunit
MFEHKLLYGSKGPRSESGAVDATSEIPSEDYIVPLSTAAVRREGKRVTVLAWLLMVHHAMRAAEDFDAEVIDVRSLSPIDWETIGASVQKTGRCMIVEEGPITGGVGAELAAGIAERWPSVRLARLASPDVPVPFTPVLENAYRPSAQRIHQGIRAILEESHGRH